MMKRSNPGSLGVKLTALLKISQIFYVGTQCDCDKKSSKSEHFINLLKESLYKNPLNPE